jgi:HD-GYP domain-containing protein (c-di-GMP phosphodiesterase class II)
VSLYKVSEAIAASLSLDQVLETLGDSCLHEVHADFVSAWLADGQGGQFERLRLVAPHFMPSGDAADSHGRSASSIRRSRRGAAHARRRAHRARARAARSSSPTRRALALASFMAVPLRVQNRLIGSVAVASFTASKRFDEGQRKLLSIIGSRAAAAIENARLYEDLQATFQQTIEGLAKAIDKMDRYTSGHSDRVAVYAVYLARAARPPGERDRDRAAERADARHRQDRVRAQPQQAGQAHERRIRGVQEHPVYGRDILDPIKFLHPLIPGVYLHHERWDGRGYPLKLKGPDIPLLARIISVADTYDAMTSDRSYRRALPHEVSLAEIERCAGTQFDPDMAGTFIENIDAYREEQRAKGKRVPE